MRIARTMRTIVRTEMVARIAGITRFLGVARQFGAIAIIARQLRMRNGRAFCNFQFFMKYKLSLVDGNILIHQLIKGFGFQEIDQRFLDVSIEAFIKHEHQRIIFKVQRHDNLLEFHYVYCNRLGLFKLAESVSGFLLEVTVRVHEVEGLLEYIEILKVHVVRVLEDTVGLLSGGSTEVRNNK
jgi:hypothetical protein